VQGYEKLESVLGICLSYATINFLLNFLLALFPVAIEQSLACEKYFARNFFAPSPRKSKKLVFICPEYRFVLRFYIHSGHYKMETDNNILRMVSNHHNKAPFLLLDAVLQ